MGKIYICLDLEATCHARGEQEPAGFVNEIIEIGAVMVVGNAIIDEFQAFVRPYKFPVLSDFCMTLTTITQRDVDGAKFFPEVLAEFREWCACPGSEIVFVSWGHYDRLQLRKDCVLHGLNEDWINEDNHISLKHEYIGWNNTTKGIGLGKACRLERLTFEGVQHRGIDDSRMVGRILIKNIDKIK